MSRKSARLVIVVIWLFSFLVAIPWAVYFTLRPIDESFPDTMLCSEKWPDDVSEITYFVVANLCLCYLIPLFIITACYVAIWIKVCRRNIPEEKGTNTGKSLNAQMDAVLQRSKLKVAKMMVVVVVIFVLSWLPLYIIFTRLKLGNPLKIGSVEERILMVAAPIAQWLGASNSCINPILYAFLNKKFRNGFAAIIKSKKCCGSIRYEYSSPSMNNPQRTNYVTRRSTRLNVRTETQCDYSLNSVAAL
ncbi:neuropeptide FF receptor 2-like protein [Dinothrombium tinctorium]|uniref:Neuropeptide FF receptor 2-like protein n=1 Tax=Dinothrombium tinctorium TaxID=1965070 RepID=A0A3S3RIM5_9ACAR|nr:neuropeptide FF receptor 2-like protein [Dinothrombium tinctorium]